MLIQSGTARVTVPGDYGRPKSVASVPENNVIHYATVNDAGKKVYTADVTAASQQVVVFLMPRDVFERATTSSKNTKGLVQQSESHNSENLEQIERHLEAGRKLLTPRLAGRVQQWKPGQRQMLEVLGSDADVSLARVENFDKDANSVILNKFNKFGAVHDRVAHCADSVNMAHINHNNSQDGSRYATWFSRHRSLYALERISRDPSVPGPPLETAVAENTDYSDRTLRRPDAPGSQRARMRRSRMPMCQTLDARRAQKNRHRASTAPHPPATARTMIESNSPRSRGEGGGSKSDKAEETDQITNKLLGATSVNPNRRRLVNGCVYSCV